MSRPSISSAIVGAVFGTVWAIVAAQGFHGAARVGITTVGLVFGIVLVLGLAYLKHVEDGAKPKPWKPYEWKSYGSRMIMAIEVIILVCVMSIVRHFGPGEGAVWVSVAIMAGMHFIVLAWYQKVRDFYYVGGAMLLAAGSALAVYLMAANDTVTLLITSITCGAVLFAFSVRVALYAQNHPA